jgi:hypothetical protein
MTQIQTFRYTSSFVKPGTPHPDGEEGMVPPGWYVFGWSAGNDEFADIILKVTQARDAEDRDVSESVASRVCATLNASVPVPGDQLREEIAEALWASGRLFMSGDDTKFVLADAALSVVAPRLAAKDAEIDRLNLEIQGHQVSDGYDKGWEHGLNAGMQRAAQPGTVDGLVKVRRAVLDLHSEFKIYDDCGHQHHVGDPGALSIENLGLTCEDGYEYSVCRECCTGGSGEYQTEDCVNHHDHEDSWRCVTVQAITTALEAS